MATAYSYMLLAKYSLRTRVRPKIRTSLAASHFFVGRGSDRFFILYYLGNIVQKSATRSAISHNCDRETWKTRAEFCCIARSGGARPFLDLVWPSCRRRIAGLTEPLGKSGANGDLGNWMDWHHIFVRIDH